MSRTKKNANQVKVKGTTTNTTENPQVEEATGQKKIVTIIPGAGAIPINVDWTEGLTASKALEKADIELGKGETVVIGEAAVEDLDKVVLEPFQMLVIDNMPSNG